MKSITVLKVLLTACLVMVACYCTTTKVEEKIPVTTQSEKALNLYEQADEAFSEYFVINAMDLWEKALNEDPQFFMAAYTLATNNLLSGKLDSFKEYAKQALLAESELSKGEELMKQALKILSEDPEADVTSIGEELIEAYPNDYNAYYQLAKYYIYIDNYTGVVGTYTKALNITEDKSPVYNILGYAYMQLEQYENARKAFDAYLELSPDLPNPYDSKGDYFMAMEDYENAYESYMRAVEIDSMFTISKNKADKVKMMLDTVVVE